MMTLRLGKSQLLGTEALPALQSVLQVSPCAAGHCTQCWRQPAVCLEVDASISLSNSQSPAHSHGRSASPSLSAAVPNCAGSWHMVC